MSWPSRKGELAESASSGGSISRRWSHDRDRAVGAPDADVDVQAPGVVALGDPAQLLAQAGVVLGADDPLVEVARPRMRAAGGERDPEALAEREQAGAAFALELHRLGEGLAAARADLDLGVDQLAGDRLGEQLVLLAGAAELLEAVDELEAVGVDERELLLEPDVKSCEASKVSRARCMSRLSATPLALAGSLSGEVEVQRVEQVDRRARGVDRDLGRHLQQLLGVVEDDLDAGLDELVGDRPGRPSPAPRGHRRRPRRR